LVSDFTTLGLFPLHFIWIFQGLVNLVYFFKEPAFCFIDSLYAFLFSISLILAFISLLCLFWILLVLVFLGV
jgi:hypothetical protein